MSEGTMIKALMRLAVPGLNEISFTETFYQDFKKFEMTYVTCFVVRDEKEALHLSVYDENTGKKTDGYFYLMKYDSGSYYPGYLRLLEKFMYTTHERALIERNRSNK